MKKHYARLGAITGALCATGLVAGVGAPPASAWSSVPAPYYKMTSQGTCDALRDGTVMRTLIYRLPTPLGGKGRAELRIRVGLSDATPSTRSVCAYVVDNTPGAHHMELIVVRDNWRTRAVDSGTYGTFAGALHAKGPTNGQDWTADVWGRVVINGVKYQRWVNVEMGSRRLGFNQPDRMITN
jgi:hypothetical protein